MFGKKPSKETLLKRSISSTGKKRSNETKIKQSLSTILSGQAKTTIVYDYITKEKIGTYHSISEACRSVGAGTSKACMAANGNRKQTKGFVFEYI